MQSADAVMTGAEVESVAAAVDCELTSSLWTQERMRILNRFGLITVTGTFPADVQAFIGLLLQQLPAIRSLPMVTTRPRLEADRDGEYNYLTTIPEHVHEIGGRQFQRTRQSRDQQFAELGQTRGYAWHFAKRGVSFGMPEPLFREALLSNHSPAICELKMKCASAMLAKTTELKVSYDRVCMVFIRTPLLRIKEALVAQSESDPLHFTPLCVGKRLEACRAEEYHAICAGHPYRYVNHVTDKGLSTHDPLNMLRLFALSLDRD